MTKNFKPAYPSSFSLLVLFCFFFSGLAGLIYQILWLRMIDKVVGSAPFAVATVLSVFMGGLALGSWLAGKYIDRIASRNNLLSLYGKAELAIGIYGLLFPLLTYAVKPVYVLAYDSLFAHFWIYRIFTFFGCSVLLIIPTTIMGVTLPVLCRFYVEDMGHLGARTGRLYGINTIGGAAGAALCGFFLIANFGMWGSLITAVGINVLIGTLCIIIARGTKLPVFSSNIQHSTSNTQHSIPGTQHSTLNIQHSKKGKVSKSSKLMDPKKTEFVPVDDRMIITLALWTFGISGFCSMAYEVFWTRLLGLIIGPTTYSFSLVVSTFIIGLAAGNIIFGRLADKVKETFRLLVVTQICAAFLSLVVSQFLGNSQFFFSKLIFTFQGDFSHKIIVQSIVLFFVLIGPTVFLGATFPLVNRIYARSLPELGRSIGTAYSVNTIGAILGSFVAGFIFIPLMGKENGLRITAGMQIFISVAGLSYIVFKTGEKKLAYSTTLATLILGLFLIIIFPSWNHTILSRGWYYHYEALEHEFRETTWLKAMWQGASKIAGSITGNKVVFYGDGIGGFTTVDKSVSPVGITNYSLLNSGKTDATSHTGRLTQALSAQIPLLFHPDPKKVMVIGLASGMTAGEALLYPVKQLDVVEINDQVIKATNFFTQWNNNCLTDPRTRIIEQDGRNHLELTREKYDVIISVPSNPWMAGLADLFSLDYFKTVKERLNKNGIFVQWTSTYDMNWDSFSMIGRTFTEVFPDGMLVRTIGTSDLLLIGFSDKKNLDLKTADKNITYARTSKNISIRDPRVIFNLIVADDLKDFFGPGLLHTDNRPYLEFTTPKSVGSTSRFIEDRIKGGNWLSKETREIQEANKTIDASLDNIELMAAGSSPPFKDVDLSKATPAQIKMYQGILKDYCSNEDIINYEIFPSTELQKECAQLQVGKIKEHLASDGKDIEAYYNLAMGLGAIGDPAGKKDALQKALSLDPFYFDAHMELGALLARQGKFNEAIDQLSEALNIRPDSAEAHNNIGNVFADAGRTGDAIEHFSRALQINPDSAEAYNNLGSVYAGLGKNEQAIENFSKALKLVPEYAVAHDNLGRVYAGEGNLDMAMAHINEALKINPHGADFHNDAGLILGRQGKITDSISQFTEALKISPDHFLANYNLGIALSGQGRVEEAIGYFSRAVETKPNDPEARKMLGIALESLGRFKEAAVHFSEALKLEPNSAEAHDNLGVALAESGQMDEAITHFNKALELNGSYEKAREHLAIAERHLQKGR